MSATLTPELSAPEAHAGPQSAAASRLAWLRIAIGRKRTVWFTAAAVAVLAIAFDLFYPAQYTAAVVLLPPQQNNSGGSMLLAQLGMSAMSAASGGGGGSALGLKNPNDQQIALLKSRVVEDAMIARFHLQALYGKKLLSSTRRKWEKHTTADGGVKDGLIRLSVTDRDPRRAADLANGWVDEYRKFTATLAITEAAQRRLFYQRELDAAHDDLAHAEDALAEVQKRTGVIDLEGQGRAMIASAAALRAQLAAKQVEIRAIRQFAAPENPDLQRAEQEASALEGQLAVMDADNDRRSGDLVAPKGAVTADALEYLRAFREVKYREAMQEILARQYEGARVDEARQGALIQVVEPAVVPDRPSGHKILIGLALLLLSMPLGVVAALVQHRLDTFRILRRRSGSWLIALEQSLEPTPSPDSLRR